MDTSRMLYIFIFSFFLTGAITLAFALVNRSKAKADKTMNDREFVLRHPWIVTAIAVSGVVIFSGMIVVTALTSEKTSEFIAGFSVFGLFAALSLILLLKALLFKVVVSGEKLTLYKAFRKPYEFTFGDIASAIHKTKNNPLADKMIIRTNTGKKIVAEGIDISYERLLKRIESEVPADRLQGFDLAPADPVRGEPESAEYGAPVAAPYDNGGAAAYYDPMEAYRTRNLTIERRRSTVGCLSGLKIYIEDREACELIINDTPCRKLGELKNGETKTFQVPARAAKVYVIAKKWSRNFSNDFFQLPEGGEDVSLSGECKFSLTRENAFCFDNNDGAEAVANRKRGSKTGMFVLATAVIVGLVIGYSISRLLFPGAVTSDRTFFREGMSITLTEDFADSTEFMEEEGYTACYDSRDVAVYAFKDLFADYEGLESVTVDRYIDLTIKTGALSSAEKKTADGLSGFEYRYAEPKTAETFHFTCYVFKTDDAFWLVEFATRADTAEKYADQIREWAKSIKFDTGVEAV